MDFISQPAILILLCQISSPITELGPLVLSLASIKPILTTHWTGQWFCYPDSVPGVEAHRSWGYQNFFLFLLLVVRWSPPAYLPSKQVCVGRKYLCWVKIYLFEIRSQHCPVFVWQSFHFVIDYMFGGWIKYICQLLELSNMGPLPLFRKFGILRTNTDYIRRGWGRGMEQIWKKQGN